MICLTNFLKLFAILNVPIERETFLIKLKKSIVTKFTALKILSYFDYLTHACLRNS